MKHPSRLFAPLLSAALLAGCGGADPKELYARAKASVAAQNYNAARIDLSAALREDPDNKAMMLLLADVQLRSGDAEAAETMLARLRRLGVTSPVLNRMEAEALQIRQQYDAALERLGNDGTAAGWRIRALVLVGQGEPQRAQQAFEQGMAAGQDVRLAADYARFLLLDRQIDKAQQVHAQMQAFAPNAFETQVLAADLAAADGQVAEAVAAFRATSQKFPFRVEPLIGLANLLDMQGKPDEALAALKRAEKLAPGDSRLKDLQLQLYSVKGDWEKVRDILQGDEATLDPISSEGMTYGEALLRLGHGEQARALFNRSVLLAPHNRYARMMLGESQLETGDARAAYRTLRPLTEGVLIQPRELELAEKAARAAKDPEADGLRARLQSPELQQQVALAGQGQAATSRRDWATAIEIYQRLLVIGQDPEVLKRLSAACSQSGRHDEAIGYADQARALAPDNPDMDYMAGLSRLNAGRDLPTAVALLQQAAKAMPSNKQFAKDLEKAKAAVN